ncbi:MAG: outer membrane beta-barrel protein [Pseudomonadota bacterium]
MLASLLTPQAASAQVSFETITTINPPPRARAQTDRRRDRGARTPTRDRGAPRPANPFNTELIRPGDPEPDDAGGANVRFDPNAVVDTGRRSPVPVDGDFSPPVRDEVPVDGDLTILRPSQPVDGANPVTVDTRRDEDRAAFDQPAAGYDPTAFSIDVSPILNERPRQLFRFEPYEPIGIRAGSFVILPSITTGVLYDSNVFQSSPAEKDVAFELVPTVRVVSNWNVHAVELGASGVFSKFNEFDSEDAREYTLEARGRLDITRRTNIEGYLGRFVTQENRSDLDADPALAATGTGIGTVTGTTTGTGTTGVTIPVASTDRADVTTSVAALTLNHRFNRLRLQLRGSVTEEDTSDTSDGVGNVIVNDDRDELETEGAVRTSWEFKPTLFAFAEVALNHRTVDAVSGEDGFSRDSRGERYRVGLSFGNADQVLRGEFSIGYGEQRPDAPELQTLRGVIIDANLGWRMNALTSVLLTLNTEFDTTTAADTPGSIARTAGVQIRHAFRENVIANAGVAYTWERFEGINLDERELRLNTGLEYFMNRNTAWIASWTYTNFDSDAPGRDYEDNELRLGLRLSR